MEGKYPIVTARQYRELTEMMKKMDYNTFVVLYKTAQFLSHSKHEQENCCSIPNNCDCGEDELE